MPNPFPGMNPFLEDPLHWRGVHLRLIAALDAQLNQTLPPDFISRVEERVYVESAAKHYYPDGIVVETPRRRAHSSGGTAVLERPPKTTFDAPKILELDAITFRERYIEIRTLGSDQLIAVVEFLSPANKTYGSGRQEYLRKQWDILYSHIHRLIWPTKMAAATAR